ncbi:MAG TPA: hypothetical protein VLT13_06050, partial [Bacteroidota bacterium]|nr:hypothetical protein [Bacteroidota bacterium]
MPSYLRQKPRILLFILVLAMVLIGGCSTRHRDVAMFGDLLNEAKEKIAPDRRTAVFDVKPEQHGKVVTLKGEVHSPAMKADLLAFLRERTSVAFEDSILALPDSALGAKTAGIVSVSVANIRTKTGHAAEMGTQAILG